MTGPSTNPHTQPLSRGRVDHVIIEDELPAARLNAGMTVFWRGGRPIAHHLRGGDGRLLTRVGDVAVVEPIISRHRPSNRVSVIICTRDRPDELRRCLASLPAQSLAPDEIIVVDNASRDDRTRAVALAAGVIYVREDRPGLDIARNAGAAAATGAILAYTDDDVLLHPGWLENLVHAFDDPQIGAVTGLVLPAELETDAQLHFETHWSFGQGYSRRDTTAADFAEARNSVLPAWGLGAGASMAFRREVFKAAGWFDERLDVGQAGCSGDSEYWYRLLAHGYTCRYEPASIAFHFHRKEMADLAHQLFHYMRGHAAALLVQNERTGVRANIRAALLHMPRWYLGRLWKSFRKPGQEADRFLWQEIKGFVSGLIFYWRRRNG